MIETNWQELPGTQWLGYGLNMITLSPVNIDAVHSSILHARRFVHLHEHTYQLLVGSTTYSVPRNVYVHNTLNVHTGYRVYNSGSIAVTALQNDMSLATSFLAVSLNASAFSSIRRCFQETSQYALYSHSSSHYSVSLRDYADYLNEANLRRSIETLPRPFSPSANTINQYKAFFTTFGSHIITSATYGARLQVSASSSSQDSEIQSRFSTYVNAAFNGVLTSGEFDLTVKETNDYRKFYASMEKTIAIRGGNQELANRLAHNPSDMDIYQRWAATHLERADLVGVQMLEIWHLMQSSSDTEIVNAAKSVQNAYEYIVAHPLAHITHVQLTVSSDWATFGLLSPEAIITEDPTAKKDYPGSTNFQSKTVGWHDPAYGIATISFLITNDGSPIHFFTSHGDGGAGRARHKGRVEVIMNGQVYINNDICGDGVNTKNFYNCIVNSGRLGVRGA